MSARQKFEDHVKFINRYGFPLSVDGQNIILDICRWIAAVEKAREHEAEEWRTGLKIFRNEENTP